ncbi:inner membrane-spanning protein YciB [Phenylobacterium kunshanense]|uniref:Inner membrane-spanning protein YciB n=1 Tax=Phenylobacterium kunshanense TaxID=1445034 RepID=A0A328BMM8_9CAUL|nr:inner membrane-spanning protein YciB [Phenylobacterium kunshanense]RAK67681.1 intracellular septation protein A [Phenylobacterium kunshanense]
MSAESRRHWVRWFVDYAPLVAFLAAYLVLRDLQQATWALVIGSAAALAVGFAVEKRIAPLPLIAGGAGLAFGAASIFFHDPRILKIKPTIMNGAFGLIMLVGLLMRKHPLKLVLGEAFQMPETAWRTLTINYMLLFFGLAILNEFVWRTQPDAVWVLFRFPGLMILTVVFTLTQVPMLMRYAKPEDLPPPPTE